MSTNLGNVTMGQVLTVQNILEKQVTKNMSTNLGNVMMGHVPTVQNILEKQVIKIYKI